MSKRIESLRRMALDCSHKKYRKRVPMSVLTSETEALPVIARKAAGFWMMLREMPRFIQEGELLVGSRTLFAPRPGNESEGGGLSKNLDFVPDAETLAVESPGFEFYPSYLTDGEKEKGSRLGIGEGYVSSHCAAGFQKVLRVGFAGLKEEALASLKNYKTGSSESDFLKSVLDILDGIEEFILTYASLAEDLSAGSRDPSRKEELKRIAEVCRHVSAKPAASFHEALQLVWFTHLFMLMENYNLMSLGRPDQYLYPYYQDDIKAGKISREEALELLSCFFIKLNDGSDLHTDNGLNIIISGLKPDGTDGTNDLSLLFMDAYEQVCLVDPQINIRWHSGTDKDFLKRAMKIRGQFPMPPMMFNDDVLIPGLMNLGVSVEHARDYCIDACQDVLIPGVSDFYPIFAGTYGIHLLTIFERYLPHLPEYSDFKSFYGDFLEELKADVERTVDKANSVDALLPEISPVPVLSMTLEGCLAKGKDKTAGGTIYNFTGFIGGGLVNITDSLAAIKKHVFDEGTVKPEELMKALGANFEGFESLRNLLKLDSPKWGNADKNVDIYGAEIAETFSKEVLKYENVRGGRFVPGLMTHHQVRLGKVVGATPDGRKQGEALAISLSPSIGQMKKGPSCALKSAMSVNHLLCPVGTSVDLTIQNSFLQSDHDLEKIMTMSEAFFEGGGLEVQYNIVDPVLLRKAQEQPDQYRDLVVRVWGFNAYFVTLQKDYQDELIARADTGVR